MVTLFLVTWQGLCGLPSVINHCIPLVLFSEFVLLSIKVMGVVSVSSSPGTAGVGSADHQG